MSKYIEKLYNLLDEEFSEVEKEYPRLQLFKENNLFIQGDIDIKKGEEFFGRFSIKIEISFHYPKVFPVVFEDKGRIPNDKDRHKFVDSNSCCLVPTWQKRIILGRSYTLLNFIDKLVVPYFANQIYFERENKFLREYSHGYKGILESYHDFFETDSKEFVLTGLRKAIGKIERNSNCFCGKKKENGKPEKFKDCHLGKINVLRMNDRELLKTDLKGILSLKN